jgi:hypothetical protein
MLGSNNMFLHLITICIGLLIAFGLQQIVDIFLRRRRARQQQTDAQALKSVDAPPPPTINPPQ